MRYLLAIALTLASCAAADTDVFDARVVGVTDGDTITVLDSNKQQHKIRFNGIDAAEKCQPFGTRSTQNVGRYVARKDVRLDCPRCGKTLDVGLAQITDGMAWWFRRYADEQTPEDQGRYESAEDEARLRKRSLWADDNPVPPWEWRRANR